MKNFTPLGRDACLRSYKEGFFAKLAELNIDVSTIEKSAQWGDYARAASNVLGLAAPMAELAMWLPPAAVTGGALLGATTALASAPFEAQKFEQEREQRRLTQLMAKAQQARAARRQRQLPQPRD